MRVVSVSRGTCIHVEACCATRRRGKRKIGKTQYDLQHVCNTFATRSGKDQQHVCNTFATRILKACSTLCGQINKRPATRFLILVFCGAPPTRRLGWPGLRAPADLRAVGRRHRGGGAQVAPTNVGRVLGGHGQRVERLPVEVRARSSFLSAWRAIVSVFVVPFVFCHQSSMCTHARMP